MSDHAICLGCGGAVDEGSGIPPGVPKCACPPPSIQPATVECPSCGGSLAVGVRACMYCKCTLATCRCHHCTAWNLAGANHCQACGRALGVDASGAGEHSGLNCPRCRGALMARRYGELDVDECDDCGGLMVTQQMMDRIVASRDVPTNLRLALPERAPVSETTVSYIKCPHCEVMMNRRAFGRISGVVVDVCRDHGVWFDPGELAQVLAFVERGGLEEVRRRDAEDLREAARSARSEQLRARFSAPTSSSRFGHDPHHDGGIWRSPAAEIIGALASLWK